MKQKHDARTIPDIKSAGDLKGYMKDARGSMVPVDMIKAIDLSRNALVRQIAIQAMRISENLCEVKKDWNDQIDKFVSQTAKAYDVKIGGKKGNISLVSYDGEFKVQIAIAERIVFDERLQIAKQQIDDCMKRWTKDSRSEIRVLINSAFDVDKQGNVNRERILGLRRLDITDAQWKKAMNIISDSIQVSSTKSYIRIYRRDETGEYKQISLDFASL